MYLCGGALFEAQQISTISQTLIIYRAQGQMLPDKTSYGKQSPPHVRTGKFISLEIEA